MNCTYIHWLIVYIYIFYYFIVINIILVDVYQRISHAKAGDLRFWGLLGWLQEHALYKQNEI